MAQQTELHYLIYRAMLDGTIPVEMQDKYLNIILFETERLNKLTKDGFANMNAHQTIYVITPEYTTGSQIILRDNLAPYMVTRTGIEPMLKA